MMKVMYNKRFIIHAVNTFRKKSRLLVKWKDFCKKSGLFVKSQDFFYVWSNEQFSYYLLMAIQWMQMANSKCLDSMSDELYILHDLHHFVDPLTLLSLLISLKHDRLRD